MALAFAGLVFIGTLVVCFLTLFAGMMRTTGSNEDDGRTALWIFCIGMGIAALLAVSHWYHIAW